MDSYKFTGGLRPRIIAWSFIPTVLILAAVALLTFTAYNQVTEDLVIERDQELTRLAAGQISNQLNKYTDLLNNIALISEIRTGAPYERQAALKSASNRLVIFDGGALILDTFGHVTATLPEQSDLIGADYSSQEYFREMVRQPRPTFSNLLLDNNHKLHVVAAAVPIFGEQSAFNGVLVGYFRIGSETSSSLYGDIVKQRLVENGTNYIVDSNGRVIYHTEDQNIGADFSSQPVVQNLTAGDSGAIRTQNYQGLEIVAGYSSIAGTPWGLVSEESWIKLLGSSQGYRQYLIGLIILGMVIPVVVVTIGVQRIVQPIEDLIYAAQDVSKGNFEQHITVRTGDEIEELANQFNVMADHLHQSYAQLEQRVADRTKELSALNTIAAVVSRSLDLDKVLNGALDKTLEVLNLESGGIYLLEDNSQALHLAAHKGIQVGLLEAPYRAVLEDTLIANVIQTQNALVIDDLSAQGILSDMEYQWVGKWVAAGFPLISRSQILGVMFVLSKQDRTFSAGEINLLTSIGHQIGVAVGNTRLYSQADSRMRELDALYQADEKLLQYLELDQVLHALVDVAVDLFQADKSSLNVWDAEHKWLKIAAARGFSPESIERMNFAPGEGVIGEVAVTGEPQIVEDVSKDNRVIRQIVEAEGIRSFMHFPVKVNNEVFGVFNVNFYEPRAFAQEDQRLFQALTQRAALAIENAQLYERAQHVATMEERQRLARELHDAVTQTLFSSSIIADVLPVIWERKPDEARKRLEELRELTRGALAEMRTLLLELRPSTLVETDISELLHQLADAFVGRTRIPVDLKVEEGCEVSTEQKIVIYRIAQEAFNNITKHAGATQVKLVYSCDQGGIKMSIEDNGAGFDLSRVHPENLGLGIMAERAESTGLKLDISSQPGQGTKICLEGNARQVKPGE